MLELYETTFIFMRTITENIDIIREEAEGIVKKFKDEFMLCDKNRNYINSVELMDIGHESYIIIYQMYW